MLGMFSANVLSKDSCGQNSHDRIFGAAYADLSSEGYAAVEHELFQIVHSYIVLYQKEVSDISYSKIHFTTLDYIIFLPD